MFQHSLLIEKSASVRWSGKSNGANNKWPFPNRPSKNMTKSSVPPSATNSTEVLTGVSGVAVPVMLFSEFTLKTTGCGLPSGPLGLYGAIEGLSYLWVVGLVGYSVYTKTTTGKGLPSGPYGLLGAAEGMSYLAILCGLVVLGFQVTEYGYIPNAIPVEGGKCY
ncbi:hypothetical protein CEUSTIGMA_g13939.t1 [Chlamydomonas eustigma]|uniref:Uncharacterized protein n=1 Tax=Chlamydomonas eustigma TaxID=1157962 RepID=A0A250XUD7_9CHLO|nr:hypothetical protein CEUSTIGMA_g13939.t1 [Chlamydomonas eustigma]|eukprot:GAX86532.1 hypothetical protein CEUSTIGMA_g13939.t1 [Chlamydomonas eustigma]